LSNISSPRAHARAKSRAPGPSNYFGRVAIGDFIESCPQASSGRRSTRPKAAKVRAAAGVPLVRSQRSDQPMAELAISRSVGMQRWRRKDTPANAAVVSSFNCASNCSR